MSEPPTETLHFLSWMRRGLGLTLTLRDTGQTDLPRAAPVDAWVKINGEEAKANISLRPADHVIGIDTAQIIRRYPAPSAGEAEYGYFPLVEVAAPDLPWVVTPAAPNETDDPNDPGTGRLRPWVVLVCVEENSAELVTSTDGKPARLIVPADQLPDLAESYAWAHVQSTVPYDQTVATLTDQPGSVIARLVCPRRLEPDTAYRAALVAAFAHDADTDALVPAWSANGSPNLLVYDTWTFATGQASSFEALCQRLGPVDDPDLVLGMTPMDAADLGPAGDWPAYVKRTVVDYTGALWDPGLSPEQLGPKARPFFENAVSSLLNQGDLRLELDPDAPDPVVTPPFFGAYASGEHQVPADHWQHDVNLDPNHRAAAGLGAEVVRRNQERFMAKAWRQAGQLRETNRQLSFARLQSEVGRTAKGRIDKLDAHRRVALMRPQLSFVRDESDQAPRRLLRQSSIPNALLSPIYQRVMRPGGVAAAAVAKRAPESPSVLSAVGDSFGSAAIRDELKFGVPSVPAGTAFANPLRDTYPRGDDDDSGPPDVEPEPDDDGPLPLDPAPVDVLRSASATASLALGAAETLELEDVAAVATANVVPIGSVRARMQARIPALTQVFAAQGVADDEIPSQVRVGPKIDEALVWSLVDMSTELLMPGAQQFPDNAVRLVAANSTFIAAFLAGANTEMTRELLWREYPADLGSTTFCRFWDRPDRSDTDIDPMHLWKVDQDELADLGAGDGDSLVLLVRGDLVRHYPTVRILLRDGDTDHVNEVMPSFGGWIPPDIRFVAFEVPDVDIVTADGSPWQVVFEEQLTEPRFGLDTTPEGETPDPLGNSWNNLSWEHLAGQGGPGSHLAIAGGLHPDYTFPAGATWGLNSAHMARATYQAPYRYAIDVTLLLGPSS